MRGDVGHGHRQDGSPREVYLYHVVDTEETWARRPHAGRDVADGDQSRRGAGAHRERRLVGRGRARPEAFDAVPFLDLLNDYGSPWGIEDADHRVAYGHTRLWVGPDAQVTGLG